MIKCSYRVDKDCRFPNAIDSLGDNISVLCEICLQGQQADELSLLNSAIGNLTASIEERLCRK